MSNQLDVRVSVDNHVLYIPAKVDSHAFYYDLYYAFCLAEKFLDVAILQCLYGNFDSLYVVSWNME